MVAPDPESPPPPRSPDALTIPNLVDPPAGRARLFGLALAAGVLAGGAGWLAGEAVLGAYRDALNPKVQREADAEDVQRFVRAHVVSASTTFAALGGILGLGLGLAGGLARRSLSAGAGAGLLGGVLGSAAGVTTSMLVLPLFFRNRDPQAQDLTLPLLTLGSIGLAIGAVGGLAFGLGLGGRSNAAKALVGGLVGAVLGTFVYEVVGGIAFPIARTELAISLSPGTRALYHLLVATLAAVGSTLTLEASPGAKENTSRES